MLFNVNEGCAGSIVVVITPLIALMVDQKNFASTGVSVEFVGKAQGDNTAVKRVL